ncbi:MAG: cob(I)yrinic acid a,c-diamide adenosyltransferase [Deltaproteobacteria bacterium]|nr:cob(I)yrinic acid a,c-diamide adenosyltransferase [Deltaproteobacteria bacterium]MBW2662296.1 cob(I)yrinic acid a,c-diamide adenosyltransferase [Deltaproteobacteria bacterium]
MKGYVQIYTGNGKGKTTAALGLSIRAAGAGLKVYIGQFIKSGEYSEINALKRFSDFITIEQFGRGCFIKNKPVSEDIKLAQKGLKKIKEVMSSGDYNIVILDEANVALQCKLFKVQDLLEVIAAKPEDIELVITGRYAAPEIIEKSDLVTEMKEIKHYFQKGVQARFGIEK